MLIILFHELCRHLKTHINNEEDTPRMMYKDDLDIKEINLKTINSGFLIEYCFVQGSIEVGNFIYSDNSKKLLNKEIYLRNNFEELNKILNSIDNSITKQSKSNGDLIKILGKNKKYKDFDENEKNIFKFNYKNLNYAQLTNIINGMDEKSFEENKEIYNYFPKLLKHIS